METVNDIIRDVIERAEIALRQDGDATVHHSAIGHMLRGFAVRLDAAYKRDLQAMVTAGECDMRTAMDEVTRLREENERLKAALKPVLEVEWPTGISGSIDNQLLEPLTYICNAVRYAQLIYNGGAK